MKKILLIVGLLLLNLPTYAASLNVSNQLFDWAEQSFPQYFSPSGAETFELSGYWVRYYKDTNAYIGTSGDDVLVYGPAFGPEILNVGPISQFIDVSESDNSDGSASNGTNTDSGGSTSVAGKAVPPTVADCSTLGDTLGENAVQKLVAKGFDKCAMVFGFLVANSISNSSATSWTAYEPTYWTQLTANILAEVLDNNQDGVADDSKVVGFMQTASKGGWMPILSTALEDPSTYEDLNEIFGPDTAMKESWFKVSISETVNEDGSSGGARAIVAQEAIHNWQTRGLAFAYPDIFGVPHTGCTDEENMSSQGCTFQDSILTRSTLEAMTTSSPQWYGQFPSGNVYNASLGYNTGDCATPNCSAIEYYYNLLTAYKGSWGNDVGKDPYDFPANAAEVIARLNTTENGKALLQVMDNSNYHQLINGISFNYGGALTTTTGTNGNSGSTGDSGSSSGSNDSNSQDPDSSGSGSSNPEEEPDEEPNEGPDECDPEELDPETGEPEECGPDDGSEDENSNDDDMQ